MPTIVPYFWKVYKIPWGGNRTASSITAYRREESREIIITHMQERKDGTMLLWLKYFGMKKWYIETNAVDRVVKAYKINIPQNLRIIRDTEYTH